MIMSVSGNKSVRIISHWALILALILSQSIALGHDHGADENSAEICLLCLHAQQSDIVLPLSILGLLTSFTSVCVSDLQQPQFFVVSLLPFQSRAPPRISL
ncbi:MAG: hypothetical protein ABFS22_13665 [Pseudomonadota bacterium]